MTVYVKNQAGLCLSVNSRPVQNTAGTIFTSCDSDDDQQQWYYDTTTDQLRNYSDTNFCLDSTLYSNTDGTNPIMSPCNGSSNQKWNYTNQQLQVFGTNRCLNSDGTDSPYSSIYNCTNSSSLNLVPTSNNPVSIPVFAPTPVSTYTSAHIKNHATGLCLEAKGDSTTIFNTCDENNTNQLWYYDNTKNQIFSISSQDTCLNSSNDIVNSNFTTQSIINACDTYGNDNGQKWTYTNLRQLQRTGSNRCLSNGGNNKTSMNNCTNDPNLEYDFGLTPMSPSSYSPPPSPIQINNNIVPTSISSVSISDFIKKYKYIIGAVVGIILLLMFFLIIFLII